MNTPDLANLLRQADTLDRLLPASGAATLQAMIQKRRRRHVRRLTLVAAVGLVGVLGVLRPWSGLAVRPGLDARPGLEAPSAPAVAQAESASKANFKPAGNSASATPHTARLEPADLARLESEAAALEREARQLERETNLLASELARPRSTPQTAAGRREALDAERSGQQWRDAAAEVGLVQAAFAEREFGHTAEAIAGYRAVLQTFPNTDAAKIAQQRLSELPAMN
ncbi:MAG TPA: hypothetical protein VFE24_05225 [Pirellulales bacterium]|jgi:hypothetical protein|nr:hypothetical protein [Pirellulales bacterium]